MPNGIRDRFPEAFTGGPVPPVDPEDMKRMCDYNREYGEPGVAVSVNLWEHILSPGANVFAVNYRNWMLGMLSSQKLVTAWEHDGKLDDKVFRLMAAFPLEYMKVGVQFSGLPFNAESSC